MSVTRFLAHLISLISFLPSAVWLFNKSWLQNRSVSAEWPGQDVTTSRWHHIRKYSHESKTRTCKYLHANALVWIQVQKEWSVLLSKRAVQNEAGVKNTQTWFCASLPVSGFCFVLFFIAGPTWHNERLSPCRQWLMFGYSFLLFRLRCVSASHFRVVGL